MKTIYLIRHCKATGQHAIAQLTEEGIEQAIKLTEFFENHEIDRIITSPYTRAIQTITPLAHSRGLQIEINHKLIERTLSTNNMIDWMEKLKETFENKDIKFEGGESSNEALKRGLEVIEEIIEEKGNRFIIVTHGNLLSLIINNYQNEFGFKEWKEMSNPDIYKLEIENERVEIKRIWK